MKLPSVKWMLLITGLAFTPLQVQAGNLESNIVRHEQIHLQRVSTAKNQVELWSRGRTLEDVLDEVNDRSGIEFHLPEGLRADPVLVNIQAPDWISAAEQLTREYSRIEIWSKNPQNSKVWILDRNPMNPISRQTDALSSEPPEAKTELGLLSEENADEEEKDSEQTIFQNEGDSILDILPHELLVEPALWVYLKSLGVPVPDEAQELFGSALNNSPPGMAIPPHILNNPKLKDYLDSIGVKKRSGTLN